MNRFSEIYTQYYNLSGMEWTECKTCEVSCKNMHTMDEHSCHVDLCEPGCQCVNGLVRIDDQCVKPNSCPCVHSGRS